MQTFTQGIYQLPATVKGNHYAIVFDDYLMKWPKVFAMPGQEAGLSLTCSWTMLFVLMRPFRTTYNLILEVGVPVVKKIEISATYQLQSGE